MKILVVDDEPAVRRMETRALESGGHECLAAGTMAEALELLASHSFDIALLDVNIGEDSGLTLAKQMQADWPDTSVIMATGVADFTSLSDARLAGAQDYLVKPLTPDDLANAVERVGALRQRRKKAAKRPSTTRTVKKSLVAAPQRAKAAGPWAGATRGTTALPIPAAGQDGEPPIDQLFRAMISRGASDLHLSTGARPMIRKDGDM